MNSGLRLDETYTMSSVETNLSYSDWPTGLDAPKINEATGWERSVSLLYGGI